MPMPIVGVETNPLHEIGRLAQKRPQNYAKSAIFRQLQSIHLVSFVNIFGLLRIRFRTELTHVFRPKWR